MRVGIISYVTAPTRTLSRNPVQGQHLYIHTLVRELHGARIARSDHQKSRLGVPLIFAYVRLLRPELDCCTRREGAGAAIEVRSQIVSHAAKNEVHSPLGAGARGHVFFAKCRGLSKYKYEIGS